MRRMTLAGLAVAAVVTGWAALRAGPADGTKPGAGAPAAFKAVVHVNFDDTDQQKRGLKNVANMLKAEGGRAEIEVVCHANGIGLVVKGKSAAAEDIAQLIKAGVRFVACENTMRERGIARDDLLPGVGTVPSGAAEVVRKQLDGYGYFKP